MAKALVTGASGFIGPHLAAALVARGDEVTCLVRSTSKTDQLAPLGVKFVHGDVLQPDQLAAAVAECDVVYHLAGLTKALRRAELLKANEQGVRNLLEACSKRAIPPTVIVVSSLAAAGPSIGDQLRTEFDEAKPVSDYGRSKRAGELAAQAFAGKVPISVVRPPIVFGEGDRATLEIFKPIHRFGVHVAHGGGRDKFSLIHAADLASGLILVADRGQRLRAPATGEACLPQGVYFVAADEHPTYAELGQMIATALGRRRVRVLSTPGPLLIWSVAALAELGARIRGKPAALNFDKVREARAGSWVCSPQTARESLGFAPQASLAERLKQTAQWYLEHKWL